MLNVCYVTFLLLDARISFGINKVSIYLSIHLSIYLSIKSDVMWKRLINILFILFDLIFFQSADVYEGKKIYVIKAVVEPLGCNFSCALTCVLQILLHRLHWLYVPCSASRYLSAPCWLEGCSALLYKSIDPAFYLNSVLSSFTVAVHRPKQLLTVLLVLSDLVSLQLYLYWQFLWGFVSWCFV